MASIPIQLFPHTLSWCSHVDPGAIGAPGPTERLCIASKANIASPTPHPIPTAPICKLREKGERLAPGLSCDSSVSCQGSAPSLPLSLLSRETGLGLPTPHPPLLPAAWYPARFLQRSSGVGGQVLAWVLPPGPQHWLDLLGGGGTQDALLASADFQNKSFEAWKAVPMCPGCRCVPGDLCPRCRCVLGAGVSWVPSQPLAPGPCTLTQPPGWSQP